MNGQSEPDKRDRAHGKEEVDESNEFNTANLSLNMVYTPASCTQHPTIDSDGFSWPGR
jgi:hypothetical protein